MSASNDDTERAPEESTFSAQGSNRPISSANTGNAPAASATTTMTMTEERTQQDNEVLPLTLRPRPQVTWEEGVVDNEHLGRKSSKRCCIFHKQRAFGESSTDSSDDDGNESDGSSSSGGPGRNSKPIARKKTGNLKSNKVPDFQRFHA